MAVDMIPNDLVLRSNNPGWTVAGYELEQGDTVTFTYEGEQRNVLVLENDGTHLKGIDKVRDGDFRCFLFSKISNLRYAKHFVKSVPVTTVKFEMLPPSKPRIANATSLREVDFVNRKDEKMTFRVYSDGSVILYKNSQPYADFRADQPHDVLIHISNFLAE